MIEETFHLACQVAIMMDFFFFFFNRKPRRILKEVYLSNFISDIADVTGFLVGFFFTNSVRIKQEK